MAPAGFAEAREGHWLRDVGRQTLGPGARTGQAGFTIDTWDFTYRPGAGTNRRINAETPMGIMHGDNSGVFQAMNQLAWMNDRLGAHILLPTGKGCRKTLVNGQEQTFVRSRVGESQYVDFVVKPKGKADMEILFQAL
jgi:hypothetical protein